MFTVVSGMAKSCLLSWARSYAGESLNMESDGSVKVQQRQDEATLAMLLVMVAMAAGAGVLGGHWVVLTVGLMIMMMSTRDMLSAGIAGDVLSSGTLLVVQALLGM